MKDLDHLSGIWRGGRWLYSDFKAGGVGHYVIAQATGEVINTYQCAALIGMATVPAYVLVFLTFPLRREFLKRSAFLALFIQQKGAGTVEA